MIIIRCDRVVNNDGGPTPQNVGVGIVPFTMEEARLMMQTILNQQQLEFSCFSKSRTSKPC